MFGVLSVLGVTSTLATPGRAAMVSSASSAVCPPEGASWGKSSVHERFIEHPTIAMQQTALTSAATILRHAISSHVFYPVGHIRPDRLVGDEREIRVRLFQTDRIVFI